MAKYTIGPPDPPASADTGSKYTIGPPDSTPDPGFLTRAGSWLYERVPSAFKGPSVGEQLTDVRERTLAKEAELGRPLTLKERIAIEPVTSSPVAMGFATHQVGEQLPGAMLKSGAAVDKSVERAYARAIKPTVAGKGTAGATQQYFERARGAISSIIDNKPNLQLTDSAGSPVRGELPKSLEQFGDAIEQTKQEIFKQYDAMAQQAAAASGVPGGPVVTPSVPLVPAASELQKIAADQVVNDLHPELAKYAQDRADALTARGLYSIADAQRAVQNLNQSLKAFYKNPTYETATRASVDALIANQLRSGLDTAIENAVGPGYQALKNQYGALKTIENDVVKRGQVVARQEAGGGILGRIADVASAEEVMRGLFTLSPTAFARGVALKGWAQYVKRLRDPNRLVAQMFDVVERQQNPTPVARPLVRSIPLSPVLPPQPNGASDAVAPRRQATGDLYPYLDQAYGTIAANQ